MSDNPDDSIRFDFNDPAEEAEWLSLVLHRTPDPYGFAQEEKEQKERDAEELKTSTPGDNPKFDLKIKFEDYMKKFRLICRLNNRSPDPSWYSENMQIIFSYNVQLEEASGGFLASSSIESANQMELSNPDFIITEPGAYTADHGRLVIQPNAVSFLSTQDRGNCLSQWYKFTGSEHVRHTIYNADPEILIHLLSTHSNETTTLFHGSLEKHLLAWKKLLPHLKTKDYMWSIEDESFKET